MGTKVAVAAVNAFVRAAQQEGDDIGESAREAVAHNGPVWVRDGPVDWEWMAGRIVGRMGTG